MPTQTQAYVCMLPGQSMKLCNVELADPGPGEVLVSIIACSICASDLKAAKGEFMLKPPLILGHEGSGIVEAIGADVTTVKPGDKVVLSFASCGSCRYCTRNERAYCDKMHAMNWSGKRANGSHIAFVLDGENRIPVNGLFFGQSSLAKHVLAHESSCVKMPPEMSMEELRASTALGCGIQTGAGAVLNVARPAKGSTIVILGAGAVGVSAALAALLTEPAMVVLVDNDKTKLAHLPGCLAESAVGPAVIKHIASSDATALMEVILRGTAGRGADVVIECVGSDRLIEAAVPALAARGTLVTVGGPPLGSTATLTIQHILARGLTWRGTHQGDSNPQQFIPHLLELKRQGKLPYEHLLTFYNFDNLAGAIADLRNGKVYKPVLVIR